MLKVVQETDVSATTIGVFEDEVEKSSRKHTACPAAFLPDLIFSGQGSYSVSHTSLDCSSLSRIQLEVINRMSEKNAEKLLFCRKPPEKGGEKVRRMPESFSSARNGAAKDVGKLQFGRRSSPRGGDRKSGQRNGK